MCILSLCLEIKSALFQSFYHATLCLRGMCHRLVSVCVCVCVCPSHRYCIKMAKHRMTQIISHDSQGSLVFWRKFGTKHGLDWQYRESTARNTFQCETTSELASTNVEPILHRSCLNPDVHAKYSGHCYTICPLLWLSHGPSVVDRPSPVFRWHGNNHHSLGVIFQWCSPMFNFSNPSGDSCIWWGTVPIKINQIFVDIVCRLLFNVKNLITARYSQFQKFLTFPAGDVINTYSIE